MGESIITATADTWINGATAAQSTNYHTDVNAFVGWVSGAGNGPKHGILHVITPAYPNGDPTAARLDLGILTAPAVAGNLRVGILDAGSALVAAQMTWLLRATAVNWNTAGGLNDVAIASGLITGPSSLDVGGVKGFDITDLIGSMPAATDVWLMLYHETESGATKQFSFETVNAAGSNPPKLVLTLPNPAAGRAVDLALLGVG